MQRLWARALVVALAAALSTAGLAVSPPAAAATDAAVVDAVGDPLGAGFWVLRTDGSVSAHGSARAVGGAGRVRQRPAAIVAYPSGGGFWKINRGGRVVAFGAARLTAKPVANRKGPFIGLAPRPDGMGFWRVTAAGEVRPSGTAEWLGRPRTHREIKAVAAHPDRPGYWILNAKGGVHAFGAARHYGEPRRWGAVAIAAHPSGNGYWVLMRGGRVFAYGAAQHHGNARLEAPARGIAAHADGSGYWITAADGRVNRRGSARDGFTKPPAGPTPDVTSVRGIVVAESIAGNVRRLLRKADGAGIRLGGWGYRSYARQVELRRQNCGPTYWDVYVASSSSCSPMTARPGSSMHERGLAIDFYRVSSSGGALSIGGTRAFRWLARNAPDHGLYNLPSEPWHWSTNGR